MEGRVRNRDTGMYKDEDGSDYCRHVEETTFGHWVKEGKILKEKEKAGRK